MSSSERPEQFADVRKHVPFLARREGLASLLERGLRYPEIRRAFADANEAEDLDAGGERNPFARVAQCLGITYRAEGLAERMPKEGPVVVVSNHGFGGADALALQAVMKDLREDFMVLANREVGLLPGMASAIFPVSILDQDNTRENTASLRAMLRHVRKGGALGVFPAGRVAYWRGDRMADPPWNEHVVKLVQRMNATIIPLWFYGNPPAGINFLSRISGLLRTALIPTGLAQMRGQEIVARAGDPIHGDVLREQGENAGPWLRRRLESLSDLGN